MLIVEETRLIGTLYRLHRSKDDPDYIAQWFVTEDGEIKGFIAVERNREIIFAFGAWARSYKGRLRLVTAVKSIAKIMERFGFIRLERPE